MKNIFLLIPIILLTGCLSAVPVKRNFPEIPEELKTACPNLKTVEEGTTQLSKVISVVSENYGSYHECKIKVDSWLEWYETQKTIFDQSQ